MDVITQLRVSAPRPLALWIIANEAHIRQIIARVPQPTRPDLVLLHDPEEGTMLRTRDRSWNEAIKALRYPRFVWSGSRGAWYVQHTANLPFPKYPLESIARQLRAAGATVEVQAAAAESAPLSIAEQEEQRKARAAGKSERYAKYAAAAAKRMLGASERGYNISKRFEFGQPILVGHHSEKRARRDRQRIEDASRKTYEESKKAEYWAQRAEAAEAHAERREDPGVVLRRIERLATELRDIERRIQGAPGFVDDRLQIIKPSPAHKERLEAAAAHVRMQIEHWQNSLGARGLRPYGPNDFRLGQAIGGSVVRAIGPKSVTVIQGSHSKNQYGRSGYGENYWTDSIPYRKLKPTDKPDPGPAPEPEAKGKHPRAALIEAIYGQHPTDARFRIGWKHAIGQLAPDKDDVKPFVLEDLDDAVLLALAESKGLGEGARTPVHPDQKVINAIHKAWGTGAWGRKTKTETGRPAISVLVDDVLPDLGLEKTYQYEHMRTIGLEDLSDAQRDYLATRVKPPIDTAALRAQGRRGK